MVYCTKCGTQNPDTATNCSNCGAPLYSTTGTTSQDRHYRHHYRRYDQDYSPRSGIGLLIAGLIIIIVGLALFFGQIGLFFAYFWPIVIVIIGIWLLIRGLLWSQRRYRQPPSP
jgi:Flp pilus assembly protein TadB